MFHPTAFKTPAGEAAFAAAYDAALARWPMPFSEFEIPSRFGSTYVTASGPKDAPPLVLLHGYMATSLMWAPNVAAFSRHHRVYAIDVMGQPGKSIPAEPIRSAADYVSWLNTTLYGLRIDRFALAGQSFGGWLALNYAIAQPDRVEKLVLLSPGGLLPLVPQFKVRGMLMMFVPTRFTVNSFLRWVGLSRASAGPDVRLVMELMYQGIRHFRFAPETTRILPNAFSAGELSMMNVPTLVLIGADEVIYDPAKALNRALTLIPDARGTLVPHSSHEMCASKHDVVDARVVDFLASRAGDRARIAA